MENNDKLCKLNEKLIVCICDIFVCYCSKMNKIVHAPCMYCQVTVSTVEHDPELHLSEVFGYACVACRVIEVDNMFGNMSTMS